MASFTRKFGWVLIVAVILLFLFPLQFGSFTQTHGPTTVLRALAFAQAVLAMMALAASAALTVVTLQWLSEVETYAPAPVPCTASFQLRC